MNGLICLGFKTSNFYKNIKGKQKFTGNLGKWVDINSKNEKNSYMFFICTSRSPYSFYARITNLRLSSRPILRLWVAPRVGERFWVLLGKTGCPHSWDEYGRFSCSAFWRTITCLMSNIRDLWRCFIGLRFLRSMADRMMPWRCRLPPVLVCWDWGPVVS